MKVNSEIILSLTFFFTLLLKIVNLEKVPVRSTIYYSAYRKCVIYKENSKICIDVENLYESIDESRDDIETINHSGKNYYEINLFEENETNYINFIITYFENKNELVFKIYNINNITDDYNKTDYTYYNESLNPLNKGINCQIRDFDFQFVCFYMNKSYYVIKMEINIIKTNNSVSITFQAGKVGNPDELFNGNFILMSFLFKENYKYYLKLSDEKIFLSINQRETFDFSGTSINRIGQNDYNNGNVLYLFALFKHNASQNSMEMNIGNGAIVLVHEDSFNWHQYSECSNLNLIDNVNIFFLKFNTEIEDFKFNYSDIAYSDEEIITNSSEMNKNEIKHLELSGTIEEIMKNIQTIMNDNVIIGETYEYQCDNYSVLIYPIDSKLLEKKTHIESFGCLSDESKITFFQMEILNNNDKSLVNQVEYQAFDEGKNRIDLSQCKDSNIKISYGIKNNSNLDISVVKSFIVLYLYSKI